MASKMPVPRMPLYYMKKWMKRNTDKFKFPLKDEDIARSAVRSLKEDYHINYKEVADKLGVKPSQFSTWLNDEVGKTVLQWLNSRKDSDVKSEPVGYL